MLEVNEYFDGKVKSIAFQSTTLPATVGVMKAGDYTFGTSQKEYMTVVSGELIVKLPGSEEFLLRLCAPHKFLFSGINSNTLSLC